MLTIKDLHASKDLDRAAMTTVSGGSHLMPYPVYGLFNAPTIDAGTHELLQEQVVGVDQSGNVGGFNGVANYQVQNGVSGQVGFGW